MTLTLGIESSCDETAAAVVADARRVLSNVVASQDELHVEYGGVVPEIASRAHVENITPVLRRALADANVSLAEIDAIAVANTPGLIGSLVVGVAAAKALAWSLSKPVIGVDHVRAHLIAGSLDRDEPTFPAIGLVVSGGHTCLFTCASHLEQTLLGSTIDDAVGEAYDKVASMIGLEYPGGPRLDKLAQRGDEHAHNFPISRLGAGSLDFSFSGLKTSVLYTVRGQPVRQGDRVQFPRDHQSLSEQNKADIAASFQRAAIGALTLKLERAIEQRLAGGEPPFCTLLVGGGVSANSRLRSDLEKLAAAHELDLRLPSPRCCLDNAAMIAAVGHHRLLADDVDDLTLSASPTARR